MKTLTVLKPKSGLILFSCLLVLISCNNSGNQSTDTVQKADTTYVPRIDTFIIFDTAYPYLERMEIIQSMDTIIRQ